MSDSEDVLPRKKRKSNTKGKEKYSVKKCEKRGCEEFRVHPKCFIQATEKYSKKDGVYYSNYCHLGVLSMVSPAVGITSALENTFVMNALNISIEREASLYQIM